MATGETPAICGRRCRNFICTLDRGHTGAHGRRYRREPAPAPMPSEQLCIACGESATHGECKEMDGPHVIVRTEGSK